MKQIAWMLYIPGEGPSHWTRTHLIDPNDVDRTLCGVKIPNDAFDYSTHGKHYCNRCDRAGKVIAGRMGVPVEMIYGTA